MKKISLIFLSLVLSVNSFGAHHEETYRGMDLTNRFGIQFEICNLREGKTIGSVNRLDAKINKVMNSVDGKASILRLTPFYAHGTAQEPSSDFIDMVVGPIPAIGNTWTDFLASAEGPKVLSDFSGLAKCHNKFAMGTSKMMKLEEMNSTDERIITLNWCTAKEGVSYQQLKAKHASWLAANKDSFKAAAWSIISPRQGAGNMQGSFAHMNVFTSLNQMFANEEWIANGGGSEGIRDYYNSYANCAGESSYTAEYIYKASN